MIVLFTSLRKDQQQIAKAEFYNIVVSLFLDKWLLDELAASLDEELRQESLSGGVWKVLIKVPPKRLLR